jgi:hypothetical protein
MAQLGWCDSSVLALWNASRLSIACHGCLGAN